MNIRDLLKDAKSVCLTGHIRPDGDSVGAVMGLYTYLQIHFPSCLVNVGIDKSIENAVGILNFGNILINAESVQA